MEDYIGLLFQARTQTHIYHLQTKSYASHKALNSFYDGLVGLIDGIVESYQGKYGIIQEYKFPVTIKNLSTEEDILVYMKKLAKYCEIKRAQLPKDTYLQNQFDEVDSLIRSTIYKLENLT